MNNSLIKTYSKIFSISVGVLGFSFFGKAQDLEMEDLSSEFENEPVEVFGSTRVINSHSVETLNKGVLEFRIEHKFGDIAGTNGGTQTFFGFDNSTDIRFAFEYGLTNKLMLGFGRSKGTAALGTMGSPYKSLLDGFAKYRLTRQSDKMPVSSTLIGTMNYTYMTASTDQSLVSNFPNYIDRLAYSSQLNIARKFGSKLSLSVMPTLVYRNLVAYNDVNALFAIGGALRYSINSKLGVIVEYFYNVNGNTVRVGSQNSLGVAVEWSTFGHVFTINITNATGFGDVQYIPYTYQRWDKGQFRLGFCISRKYIKD